MSHGVDIHNVKYSRARLIRTQNMQKICVNYPSMLIIRANFTLCFFNGGELCTGQPCELSGRCELARVKLSGLYCNQLIVLCICGFVCLFYFLTLWHKNRKNT